MPPFEIRTVGDPVLRVVAEQITDIDADLVRTVDDMLATMYAAPGIGLAATQVGITKRLFVYDIGEGPRAIVNPVVSGADGEWVYEEGCLSVPGHAFEIVRPKQVHVTGVDLDGNDISLDADELLARLVQHELDHLDGVLLLERLDDDERARAIEALRADAVAAGVDPDRDDLLPAELRPT